MRRTLLINRCNRGKFHENEARKSGKVWLVTRNGMNRLTRK
ncbi:helix-turn-helix domain-containing protein [Bacillus thuringiensis]|nr:helix-turn-helix domain-containing protein [Bacillus thuringiensis]